MPLRSFSTNQSCDFPCIYRATQNATNSLRFMPLPKLSRSRAASILAKRSCDIEMLNFLTLNFAVRVCLLSNSSSSTSDHSRLLARRSLASSDLSMDSQRRPSSGVARRRDSATGWPLVVRNGGRTSPNQLRKGTDLSRRQLVCGTLQIPRTPELNSYIP